MFEGLNLVDLFVALCFLVGISGAFFTAFHPNIMYAAISLIMTLVSVAGLYAALGADFLAAAQMIIYVGGILIVILFAVMMSEDIRKRRFAENIKKYIAPGSASLLIFIAMAGLISQLNFDGATEATHEPTTRAMGWALVGPYAVPFQYVVIVLLVGLIGAVVIARPVLKHTRSSLKEGSDS